MIWKSHRNNKKSASSARGHYSRLCRLGIETLEPKLLLAADAFEVNDTIGMASVLTTPGSQTINNLTIDAGDVDFFRWQASNSGGARIGLSSAANIDLEVYDSTGTVLLADSLNSGSTERVEIAVASGQDYLIKVLGETLQITNPGYSLSVLEIPLDGFEPNNSRATAHDLMSTTPTLNSLSLHTPADNDFFRFVAPGDGTFVVDATFLHSNGNVDIVFQSSNGSELARSDSLTNNEFISIELSGNEVVYVQVFSETGEASPNYSLDFGFSQVPSIGAIGLQETLFGRTVVVPLTLSDPDNQISELKLGAVSSNTSVSG